MTRPGPHAHDETVHPRLTVALVPPAPPVDLADLAQRPLLVVIDEADLRRRADEVAQMHAPGRVAAANALRAAADRIQHDLEQAVRRVQDILAAQQTASEGATWAVETASTLDQLYADVDAAREALDVAEAEQRQARSSLERVLEQSAAAGAAMEDANRELGDLTVSGMDENLLRRELEASGESVRKSQETYSAAAQNLAALQAERDAAVERLEAFESALAAHAATAVTSPDTVAAVQRAYDAWHAAADSADVDKYAQDLADALTDLQADLDQLQAGESTVDPSDLAAAEARVAAASQTLEQLRGDAAREEMDAAARADLDAAHDAVLAAEERTGRRIGGAQARKQVDEARAKEQAILDRFGFASYIDVVLTGGRQPAQDPAIMAAEQELRTAMDERGALRSSMAKISPERTYLDGERNRLLAEAAKVLGSDPGADVVARLRAHRPVDAAVSADLRQALLAAGVQREGQDDPAVAAAWLEAQHEHAQEQERWAEAADKVQSEVAGLRARLDELHTAIPEAESTVAAAAEDLEMSARSVGAFEAELSVRADEDAKRLKRLAAAEQLRAQVEAMSATLAKAESAARQALDTASIGVTDSERAHAQAQAAVSRLADRARRLAALLPSDQVPSGEPLETLPLLADRLEALVASGDGERAEAEAAERDLSQAHEKAVAEAQAAATGAEQAIDADWVEALAGAVNSASRRVTVIERALDELPDELRDDLLEVLADGRTTAPVVLLTARPETVGWAIELPDSAGTVRNLDAVLNSAPFAADTSSGTDLTDTNNGSARSAGRR